MKIIADENIPKRTVAALRSMGHDVVDIRGTSDAGVSDADLWKRAQADGALLITTDKGFSRRWSEAHFGILVVRLRQPNRLKIHERVLLAMQRFSPEQWPGLLVVMRDRVQTVRRGPKRH